MFFNINTNQTSKEQYFTYKAATYLGISVQRGCGSKVSGLQFHRCYPLRMFLRILDTFSRPIFCRTSHNLICNKFAILKNKILDVGKFSSYVYTVLLTLRNHQFVFLIG